MILFHQLHFFSEDIRNGESSYTKTLAILVPFSMLDAKKSQKKQDLTWRESPKILGSRVSLEISTVLRDSWRVQVSRYPRVQWMKIPKKCFLNRLLKSA